jgi:hypothetical protein
MHIHPHAQNCLYLGHVFHKRLQPFVHQFNYRVFYLWLDIDNIAATLKPFKIFSFERFNVLSFYNKDHGPRNGQALRPWVDDLLKTHGFEDCVGGRVQLLCYPRLWGYVFNPLSLYFCYNTQGQLGAILHEVKNTFGEQHTYVLPATTNLQGLIKQSCQKSFFVSPFIQMHAAYDFTLKVPGQKLAITIQQTTHNPQNKPNDTSGHMLVATLTGTRHALSFKNLCWVVLAYPLMTLKVMLSIHYQAFHLWRKGATYYRRQPQTKDTTGQ